ncbi:MAG: ComF family protein [Candidatus Amulumruptor caecigallinarius]|nr:ComF family protein [Candidatus Amulumruptor caecigallinarius]MCM1397784.1 ComF family protein [Candidatus Amulumruptor caecigallinarius]MCM1454823.1 ComF family protein [bacterium]
MPLRPPRSLLRRVADAAIDTAWPRLCEACGAPLTDAEDVICLHCELTMPLVRHSGPDITELERRLLSTWRMERVCSMFWYYRGDPYARLIHHTKYDRRPRIGRILARACAAGLRVEGFFDGVDLLVPVPLHPLKLWQRGYNQSVHIALGISEATGIPVAELLRATRLNSSQTRYNAAERWTNVKGTFALRPGAAARIGGSHVLLVDDVITTGATLLDCIRAIHDESPQTRISAFTLAATHLS